MKKLKLIISPRALEDLSDIWSYIALDNIDAADNFTGKIYELCKSLSVRPGMGRARDELLPGMRSLPFKGYIIFHIADGRTLKIIRVLHGARDIDSLF
jgi:toxin ParE1/3/4